MTRSLQRRKCERVHRPALSNKVSNSSQPGDLLWVIAAVAETLVFASTAETPIASRSIPCDYDESALLCSRVFASYSRGQRMTFRLAEAEVEQQCKRKLTMTALALRARDRLQ